MAAETSLLSVGEMFLAIALAGALASRIGLSVIPIYLVAGLLVGPNVLGALGGPAVPDGEVVTILAELGIVLLLFFLGLEFSIDRLIESWDRISRGGLLDLGVNFPVGVGLGLLFGWSLVEALLLGGIVYISSSAIITKSLLDLGWIANDESEPILGVLVFEDLFIAVYLAVVASLVFESGGLAATLQSVGIALGFLFVLLAAVQFGESFFSRVLDVSSGELFVLRVLGIAVPVAGLALALGVSEAVAAFFVGMGFSGSGHEERIERLLTPVRDTFAAVFFFWIGLRTDPRLILGVLGILAVVVVATTPTKLLSGFYTGRLYGLTDRRSFRVGTTMITRGEFSLIIAATAAGGTTQTMTQTIPALAVGYVLVMSVVGTVAMQYSDRLESLVLRRSAA
ncbi:cation:proton antiporter [Salinirubrum litoreum]|uniref:Cation:proton antiporter n=1 Tax=Salinirubrum litoreum TaxID=1126234 RepID=A0ABD5RDA4_9EURY|nr:cation:proton antiporter [Salinirubrum litoreum]